MRPDQLPERPLDPDWPGDADPQEEMERRQKLREDIPRDFIREWVNEAMDDDMCDMLKQQWIDHTPTVGNLIYVAQCLRARLYLEAEDYIERNI